MATTGVEIKYGGYKMTPAPLLEYQREVFRAAEGSEVIGGLHRITLNGTLYPLSTGAPDGPTNVFKAEEDLFNAFNTDYREFYIDFIGGDASCTGTVICGRPFIDTVSITSNDNWARTANYTIELIFAASAITGTKDLLASGLNLRSTSTNYSVEYLNKGFRFGDEVAAPVIQVSRSVSVEGLAVGSGNLTPGFCEKGSDASGVLTAFDHAKNYISGIVGPSGNNIAIPDLGAVIFGVDVDDTIIHLIDRSVNTDKVAGTIDLSDTFIAIPTGTGSYDGRILASGRPYSYPAMDTFNLEVSSELENGVGSVTINGDVQGYPSFNNNKILVPEVGKTAFENASGYFVDAQTTGTFSARAGAAFSGTLATNIEDRTSLPLNTKPISKTFGYNISEGTVNYSFSYNNRPANCNPSVLSETISVTKNNAVDVHASLTILGREAGPILQDIGTKTAITEDLNIEAVVVPYSGCRSGNFIADAPDYGSVVSGVENNISGGGNTFFRTADNETYDVKAGRYSRQVSWIYTPCS